MNQIGVALTALMLLAMVVFMAPNIIAMNQGKILRNTALWLALFLAAGLLYKYAGPGRTQPLNLLHSDARAAVKDTSPTPPKD